MNYLQLVNGVLDRLREPQTVTVRTTDDPVVNVVKHFVNDAKRHVEACHSWNATRNVWQFGTVVGRPAYILDQTAGGARVTQVSRDDAPRYMEQWDLRTVISERQGSPWRWAWEGTDDMGNLMLRFDPIPDDVYGITVLGHRNLPDLDEDTDELRLPHQPVIYCHWAVWLCFLLANQPSCCIVQSRFKASINRRMRMQRQKPLQLKKLPQV